MSTFSTRRPLRFGDCDPSGIAYFPAYFDLLNGVVEEFWGWLDFPWSTLIKARRIGLPTVHLESDFTRPSAMGDLLDFGLAVTHLGSRSLEFAHTISSGAEARWSAKQVVVATDLDTYSARPWPDDIRGALARFMESP